MYRRNLDIAAAGGAALLGGAAYAAHLSGAIMIVLGVALFFAPGYLWSEAILSQRLPGLERVLTSGGLSLILPIIGGFLFYGLGIPLRQSAWVGLLVVLTLLGVVAVAIQRLREGPVVQRQQPGGNQRRSTGRLTPLNAVIFGAAGVVALAAVAFSVKSADAQKFSGYTMLWMTSTEKNVPQPPGNQNQPPARVPFVLPTKASLGVTNHQGVPEQYMLKLLKKGKVSKTWEFDLADGQTWQQTIAYTLAYPMAADLYELPNVSKPYRYVHSAPS